MIKRIILSFTILLSISNFAIAQRLVKLNMLEKSPLSNMVVYSTNDSTARYTKLLAGTGIQINYNEGDTTLTIIATGTSVGVPQELSLNDATRELSITDGNTVDLSESIQDEVATLLQAGSNITLTYDDGAGTLTIAATGGGGGATNLGDLGDVTITSATTGQVLKYDGAAWINGVDLNTETLGALTDVDTTGKTDGSIILYDGTSGKWEAQANSIDNLTDGRVNAGGMYLGNTSAFNPNGLVIGKNVASNLTNALSTTNVLIGYNIVTDTLTPSNSVFIGANQKHSSGGGASYNSLAIGNNVALNGKVVESTVIGISAAPNITGNLYNTIIGGEAASNITGGGYNTIIGHRARLNNGSDNNSIVIGGASTYTGVNTGKGSNTAVFGNSAILGTYLYGNLNLNGYGLGNKEAGDIGKTASAYIAGYATDGTLIELPSSGLGISLTDLSVTQNSPGTAGLTYNNTNGVFTYTPPDLSSYLTTEVDGSVTNEIQDLSLTGNVLSLSNDATTVDLSPYLDDQTVTLTGGGITAISGTYPNFTITSTEVDGSVTNEIQDLSLTGNTLSLSSDATTVDLSTYLDDQTVVLTQGGIVSVSGTYPNFTISATEVDGSVTNEIQDLSLTGNTLSLSSDATTVDLSAYLDEATTASNGLTLSGTDVKLGGTLSDATTTINMNSNALTFTNNGGYNLSGTGGLSFTNTSATDYSSVLSIASTNTRIYADGGTTEPLNSINLTSSRSGVKEMDIRSSVSNDNGTYTLIALNPTRLSIKTPNVTDVTAQNGQFLKLVDRLTGEVEFDDIIDLTSLSVTTNSAGTAALSYNNTNGVFTYTPPDLSSYLTAEVDGSVTNEIQDLSLSGNTLSLSGDATTVDLSGYLDEATTASNGLTEVGNDIRLGGTLSTSVDIDALSTYNFSITDAANLTLSSSTVIEFNAGAGGVINNSTNFFQIGRSLGKILDFTQGTLRMDGYGVGNKEATDLSKTGSGYLASFATDGTLIEYPISSISGESTTASNGLTLSGSDVKLGGTLSEITNISMAGFNASIYDVSSNTGFAIQPSSNLIVNYGTQAFDDYGSGNKEAADLSKTKSNYKAAFATDGTLIEVDDIDAMVIACSDETTDITTGTAKVTFRAPHAMTITGVRASLTTASSSGTVTIDINEDISSGGASILGTKLTIDANEKTSTTAATAATITDTAIADDAEITIDIDAAGTGATGLKVTILYRKN